MDPINNLNQIVETLRRQLTSRPQSAGARKTAGVASAPRSASVERPTLEELQGKIRERLRGINPDDENQRKKAVKIFLESVLRWEFGDALINDPRFHEMVEDVQSTMELHPNTRDELRSMIMQMARA